MQLCKKITSYIAFSCMVLGLFLCMLPIFKLPNDPFSSWEIVVLFMGASCFFILSIKVLLGDRLVLGKAGVVYIAFLLYTIFLDVVRNNATDWEIHTLLLCCFFGVYLLIRNEPRISSRAIFMLLLASCTFQMGMGLLQYIGILNSRNSFFNTLGVFSNPGPWGCYMALGGLLALLLMETAQKKKWAYIILALFFVYSLILSESRTGLMGLLAGSIILYWDKCKKYLLDKKVYVPLSFFIVIMLIVMYNYKADSANGRLFIWQRSMELFRSNPIFGLGTAKFQPAYMERQATYFSTYPHDTHEAYLADVVKHPFNEWILLMVERGFIGLILVLLGLYFLVFPVRSKAVLSLLCAIFVFSLFSYPLKEAPFSIWLALVLGLMAKDLECQAVPCRIPKYAAFSTAILLTTVMVYWGVIRHKAYVAWKIARKEVFFGSRKIALEQYTEAYYKLHTNGYFMYNYGSSLVIIDQVNKALPILESSLLSFSDYQTYMFIGEIYQNKGQIKRAIQCYKHANNMVPNRLEPLYCLLKMYQKNKQKDMVIDVSKKILKKKIKVPSSRTKYIINEAKKYL